MGELIVTCDNLVKIYKVADLEVVALQGVDLEVQRGEFIALVGASGSGKSTLLNLLGGLDVPSAGRCQVGGNDLTRLTDQQRVLYRRRVVGHLWQQAGRNLLPELNVLDNVAMPALLDGIGPRYRRQHARELLDLVGLGSKLRQKPYQLSGGEQQRAGLAVAVANQPELLLADEPTGELDSVTAAQVLHLLRDLNQHLGLTTVIVTHDPAVAAVADRTIAIRNGRMSTETVRRAEPMTASHGRASAVIGLPSATHREAVLIDRSGQLQLPREALDRIAFAGKAEVIIHDDHVELWPTGALSSTTITQQ